MKKILLLTVLTLLLSANLFAQDPWQATYGPYGGMVNEFDERSNGDLFASTSNGLYISTDGGSSWELFGLFGEYINSMAFNSQGHFFVSSSEGLRFSDDNGATWSELINNAFGHLKEVEVNSEDEILLMGRTGHSNHAIYFSDDNGQSWVRRENSFAMMTTFELTSDDVIIAGTLSDGIYESDDNAQTWVKIGLGSATVRKIHLESDDEIVAGTNTSGVFYSVNGGSAWTNIGLEDEVVYTVGIDDQDNIIAGTYNSGVFITDDLGNNWVEKNTGVANPTMICFFELDNGDLLLGSNGGVLRSSDNCNTWTYVNESIRNTQIQTMVSFDDKLYAGSCYSGIFVSDDNGINWEPINNGINDLNIYYLAVNSQGYLFSASAGSEISMSTDNGSNWNTIRQTSGTYMSLGTMLIADNDDIYVGITRNGLYRSTDNGSTWDSLGLGNTVMRCHIITSDGTQFIGTYQDNLLRSTDGGSTWTTTTLSASNVYALVEDDDGNIFAGDDNGNVWKSSNGGDSWTLSRRFALNRMTSMFVDPNGIVYVGMLNGGVVRTLDNGANWETFNYRLMNTDVHSLCMDESGYIYAGTTTGVYTTRTIDDSILEIPVLTSPFNNAVNIEYNPELEWERSLGATYYEVIAATDQEFNDIIIEEDNVSDNYYVIYNIPAYTKVYWKVRAKKPDSTSEWSEIWNFTTRLQAPNLIYPRNNDELSSEDVDFVWSKVDNAVAYLLQISTDSSFTPSEMIYDEAVLDTTFEFTLMFEEQYYWRVMARSNDSESNFSNTNSFTIGIKPPTLILPENGASDLDSDVQLKWETANDDVYFALEIAYDDLFDDIVWSSVVYDTFYDAELLPNKTYYWRVRSVDEDNTSSWSETWTFSTGMIKPELLSPADGSKDLEMIITFRWANYENADHYKLQIAKDSDFNDIVQIKDELFHTFIELEMEDHSTRYFWRVLAVVDGKESPWSDTWNFVTVEEPLTPPDLYLPNNGDVDLEKELTLVWIQSKRASFYTLELSKARDFSYVIHCEDSTIMTHCSIKDLDDKTQYYWRVKAGNSKMLSEWSEVFSFTTKATINSVEDEIIESQLKVYPNPFRDYVNIKLNLLNSSDVVIEIYDLLGNNISQLADTYLPSGSHSFTLSSESLVNGMYILSVKIGDVKLSRQILFID